MVKKMVCNHIQNNSAKSIGALPKLIVTDGSFALMNSVLEIFNDVSFLQYLCLSYELLVSKKDAGRPKVLLQLCNFHFLKTVVSHAKTISVKAIIRKDFIQCVSLLIDSSTIYEFEKTLEDMIHVFLSKKKHLMMIFSLNLLNSKLQNRVKIDQTIQSQIEISESEKIHFPDFDLKLLAENSPFQKHFDSFVKRTIPLQPDGDVNEYYSPELFSIIRDRFYDVPIWTTIMTKPILQEHDITTRITSNVVERYFGIVKNVILQDRIVMPSEFTLLLYSYQLSKYVEFYKNSDDFSLTAQKSIIESWASRLKSEKSAIQKKRAKLNEKTGFGLNLTFSDEANKTILDFSKIVSNNIGKLKFSCVTKIRTIYRNNLCFKLK
jgi:hypothetical protein